MRHQFTLLSSGLLILQTKTDPQEKLQSLEGPSIQTFLNQIIQFASITADENKKLQTSLKIMRMALNAIPSVEFSSRVNALQKIISSCASKFSITIEPVKAVASPVPSPAITKAPVVQKPQVYSPTSSTSTVVTTPVVTKTPSQTARTFAPTVPVKPMDVKVDKVDKKNEANKILVTIKPDHPSSLPKKPVKKSKKLVKKTTPVPQNTEDQTLLGKLHDVFGVQGVDNNNIPAALGGLVRNIDSLPKLAIVAKFFETDGGFAWVRLTKKSWVESLFGESLFSQCYNLLKARIAEVNKQVTDKVVVTAEGESNLKAALNQHRHDKGEPGILQWLFGSCAPSLFTPKRAELPLQVTVQQPTIQR